MDRPKMSRKQARILWNSLTPQQKDDFNKMIQKMQKGELELKEVNVTDDNQIKTILLDDRVRPSKPAQPFYKHFHIKE